MCIRTSSQAPFQEPHDCFVGPFSSKSSQTLDRVTFAASTILAVASASSLAAASSFFELSTSTSASASDLMAFTRSEVAWANTRA